MNKMNKKGKIIGLSLVAIMVVLLFAVAIPSVAAPAADKPDLVITDIWVEGNRIQYTIENIGDADAPTSYTGLYINGIYRARDRVDPLAPGAPLAPGSTSTEEFAGYNYRGGEIKVCADYQDRIDEIYEDNNCRGGLPDLVITDKYETVDADTCEFMVHFKVCNIGEVDAGPSVACIHIEGTNHFVEGVVGNAPGEVPVPPLDRDTCSEELTAGPYECPPCEIVTIAVEADNYDEVEECNEENNILENEFHCPAPDLVIIDKYETVNPEDCTFTVTYTVHNNGNCIAGGSVTTIWIDGVPFMEDPVPPLAPCETYTNEVGPFECIPCTTVTVGVEADNYNVVEECNEENNLLENEFHCPAPDLVIIEKYETVNPEDCTFTVTYTVHNNGNCIAGGSVTTIWMDYDDVWEDPVPPLAPCETYTNEVGPFDCPPCEFVTIGVEADNYDDVAECNDDNNLLENEFHCPAPDLVITSKCEKVCPLTCKFRVIFTVNNIGNCDAGPSVACVYIGGVLVRRVGVGPLAAGQCTGPIMVGPFDCTPCEILTIKVEADNDNDVEECDEENNILENEFHCPGPDLIILDKYETVNPEDCTFTVTFVVANFGICWAGRSTACVYVDGMLVRVPIPILGPGRQTPKITVGPFKCTPCEELTIGVEADNDNDVAECDEENNILENEFHCPGPDLVITDKEEVVDPETGTFTVTYTVNNIGFCDAGESTACVYINGVHQGCSDVAVGPLAADDCTGPIVVGPFNCPLGEEIEVKVCADNYDAVEECDEENNCMKNRLPCPGVPLPDLVITEIDVINGKIHYTIANIGGADAPTSSTGLWIDGRYLARDRVDQLAPGAPLAPGSTSNEEFARYNYKGGEIMVCADYQDRIVEIDGGNNCLEGGNND